MAEQTGQRNDQPSVPERELLLWWVMANTVAWPMALTVMLLGSLFWVGLVESGLVTGFLLGASSGFLVGVLQWMVLRYRITRARWWILANTVGWGVGGAVAAALPAAGPASVNGTGPVAAGLTVAGGLQWLLLRRQGARAGLWALANGVGWSIIAVVLWAVRWLGAEAGVVAIPTIVLVAVGVGPGAVFGVITGPVLVRLIRQPALVESEAGGPS